jgi:hypothetical protein
VLQCYADIIEKLDVNELLEDVTGVDTIFDTTNGVYERLLYISIPDLTKENYLNLVAIVAKGRGAIEANASDLANYFVFYKFGDNEVATRRAIRYVNAVMEEIKVK